MKAPPTAPPQPGANPSQVAATRAVAMIAHGPHQGCAAAPRTARQHHSQSETSTGSVVDGDDGGDRWTARRASGRPPDASAVWGKAVNRAATAVAATTTRPTQPRTFRPMAAAGAASMSGTHTRAAQGPGDTRPHQRPGTRPSPWRSVRSDTSLTVAAGGGEGPAQADEEGQPDEQVEGDEARRPRRGRSHREARAGRPGGPRSRGRSRRSGSEWRDRVSSQALSVAARPATRAVAATEPPVTGWTTSPVRTARSTPMRWVSTSQRTRAPTVAPVTVIALRDRRGSGGLGSGRCHVVDATKTEGGRQSGESWVRWDICPARYGRDTVPRRGRVVPPMSNRCSVGLSTRSDHLVPRSTGLADRARDVGDPLLTSDPTPRPTGSTAAGSGS